MNFVFYVSLCLIIKSTTIIAGNTLQNTLEGIIYPSNSKRNITFEDISSLYHLPAEDAAKKLAISTSFLKKICRNNRLERWPYRKFKFINDIIEHHENIGDTESLEKLKRIKNELIKDPNMNYNIIRSKINYFNSGLDKQKKYAKESSNYKDFQDRDSTKPKPQALPTKLDLSEPAKEESKKNELLLTGNTEIVQESMDQTSDSENEQEDLMEVENNELEIDLEETLSRAIHAHEKSFNLTTPMDNATKSEFMKIKEDCKSFINYGRLF